MCLIIISFAELNFRRSTHLYLHVVFQWKRFIWQLTVLFHWNFVPQKLHCWIRVASTWTAANCDVLIQVGLRCDLLSTKPSILTSSSNADCRSVSWWNVCLDWARRRTIVTSVAVLAIYIRSYRSSRCFLLICFFRLGLVVNLSSHN